MIVTAAALIGAGVALAGSTLVVESSPEGTANGLSYRSATFVDADSAEYTVTFCPGRRVTSGGGAFVSGATSEAPLIVAVPDKPTDATTPRRGSWTSGINNLGAGAKTLVGYAICARPRGIVRNTKVLEAPVTLTSMTVKAPCPAGSSVLGGGFDTNYNDSRPIESAPYDGGDRGRVPDDGWRGRAVVGDTRDFQVTAICLKGRAQRRLVYRERTDEATGNLYARAKCPDGAAATGGGAAIDGGGSAFINSTYPDDVNGDGTPEDAWSTFGHSTSSAALTTFAVCRT
jgi:hypothetical protein